MNIEVSRKSFVGHVKRICAKNIRKPCNICIVCPFQDAVLNVMREERLRFPNEVALKKLQGKNKK